MPSDHLERLYEARNAKSDDEASGILLSLKRARWDRH
jgi:hypothetical protein